MSRQCNEPRKTNPFRNSVHSSNDGQTVLKIGGISGRDNHEKCATYLRAKVGNTVCNCLLDTGSETTLIPASIVDKAYIQKTTHVLKAANGTAIPVLGEIIMSISLGKFESKLHGLVSEHIAEVMLGIDWLTENDVLWEFGRSRIKIAGQHFQLHAQSGREQWNRRVILEKSVLVPPRSEMDIPSKVLCRPWAESPNDLYWSTESTTLKPGLHVSRTLLPNDIMSDVPVRVINVRSESIQLSAGTVVADVQPVHVIENQSAEDSQKDLFNQTRK